jgi:hypothetical protein
MCQFVRPRGEQAPECCEVHGLGDVTIEAGDPRLAAVCLHRIPSDRGDADVVRARPLAQLLGQ